jgi:hypothetical protein
MVPGKTQGGKTGAADLRFYYYSARKYRVLLKYKSAQPNTKQNAQQNSTPTIVRPLSTNP